MNSLPKTIDIFCRIIDNFGDIGVSWRLAKSLSATCNVRLCVDDLESFHKIEPSLNPKCQQQFLKDVEVQHWHEKITSWHAADLVIETFACELPKDYLKAMKDVTACWLNLDYLSAEKWVDDFHLQPSIQANGVPKYFFFPGFTEKTGGLLRPQKHIKSETEKSALLARLLSENGYAFHQQQKPLLINLFCYPDAPLESLILACPKNKATMIVLAKSVAPTLENIVTELNANIYIERLDFIEQEDYDVLLQVTDINLIRGEDSFTQAHWAAKPMLWHIYPQDEDYHLVKLNAWLTTINAPSWLCQLNILWNKLKPSSFGSEQHEFFLTLFKEYAFQSKSLNKWQELHKNLYLQLAKQPSLSQQIISFYEECLKKS